MDDLQAMGILSAVLSVGILIQSSSGFAAGLLTIPLLLMSGAFGIPEAQAALLISTVPQNLFGVWSFRSEIDARDLVWPGLLRLAGLPIGVGVLLLMETLPRQSIQQMVGVGVVAATLAILYLRPRPQSRVAWPYTLTAFLFSGFFQGLVGMGGPMMVFWVQAHDWSTRRSRGFLFSMYLISLTPALAVLYYTFGDRILAPMAMTAILIPWLLVVTWLGLKIGDWLGRKRLRAVTIGLLLILGVVGILSPLFR